MFKIHFNWKIDEKIKVEVGAKNTEINFLPFSQFPN